MRVLICGPVTAEHIETAREFFGITPTAWVHNDLNEPPKMLLNPPSHMIPIDKKLGVLGKNARDYTLVQNADAAIIVGDDEHLANIVRTYGLPLMEVDE